MSVINLPELPRELEFEEYLSAFFQCGGSYIERNLIDREIEDVLELDIISTNYLTDAVPAITLIEAKSGEWSFGEVFKIRGWLDYLNISRGLFIVTKDRSNFEFYRRKAKEIGIELILIADLAKSSELLFDYTGVEKPNEQEFECWRFSYWVERNLLKLLKRRKKMNLFRRSYQEMDKYLFTINSQIFFTENIVERANTLYTTYQSYPNLSAKLANELSGNPFDEEYNAIPQAVFAETYYTCKLNDIAISTYIEHRARLAVMKSVIDYMNYERLGLNERIKARPLITAGGETLYTTYDALPQSFIEGLNTISTHPYYTRYPVFWQWFLWIMGGFILKDYEEREYEILATNTGIPVTEVPNALMAYDLLFPREDSWFMDIPNTSIKTIKLFSVPFRGIGAAYRKAIYTSTEEYNHLQLTGQYTRQELIKWNNVTYALLRDKG